jgi:hypothetical protein
MSNNHLALHILDMSYMPRSASTLTLTSTVTPNFFKRKQDHWSCNVESSTPSKRIRWKENSPSPEAQNHQTPGTTEKELEQQLSTTTEDALFNYSDIPSTQSQPSPSLEPQKRSLRKRN